VTGLLYSSVYLFIGCYRSLSLGDVA
jgi:hypothetical protein